MVTMQALFDLSHTAAKEYLEQFTYPWDALAGISDMILALGDKLGADYREVAPQVWAHDTAKIAASACIAGPCIIGPGSEVRHCAFIRGSALVGENCVVGNSAEVKNVILFDGVQVPHYNYVGDSILGYKAHLGAGAVTSNVRSDKQNVVVQGIATNRKKVGAMVGDFGEVGCNAVLNPGTVLGRNCQVYPTACVRGVLPEGYIFKNDGTIVKKN